MNMNRYLTSLLFLLIISSTALSQSKYYTKRGHVSFFSETPIENIEALNKKGTSVLDVTNGKLEWAVLIKAFQFEKALMQEHFNENYMESGKFPKATFVGQIVDYEPIDLSKNQAYTYTVKGDLKIRDITKPIETKAVLTVENGKIKGESSFEVKPEDYGIKIPSVVRENIARIIEVKVDCNYEALKSVK